jgi:hypothetical protein
MAVDRYTGAAGDHSVTRSTPLRPLRDHVDRSPLDEPDESVEPAGAPGDRPVGVEQTDHEIHCPDAEEYLVADAEEYLVADAEEGESDTFEQEALGRDDRMRRWRTSSRTSPTSTGGSVSQWLSTTHL